MAGAEAFPSANGWDSPHNAGDSPALSTHFGANVAPRASSAGYYRRTRTRSNSIRRPLGHAVAECTNIHARAAHALIDQIGTHGKRPTETQASRLAPGIVAAAGIGDQLQARAFVALERGRGLVEHALGRIGKIDGRRAELELGRTARRRRPCRRRAARQPFGWWPPGSAARVEALQRLGLALVPAEPAAVLQRPEPGSAPAEAERRAVAGSAPRPRVPAESARQPPAPAGRVAESVLPPPARVRLEAASAQQPAGRAAVMGPRRAVPGAGSERGAPAAEPPAGRRCRADAAPTG